MKRLMLFAVLGITSFMSSIAQGVTPPRDAVAAANKMIALFADSWNKADGASYGQNYWPEAELVDPSGHICHGKAEIVQEHVDMWAGPFKGSHLSASLRRMQMLGANYMIVDVDTRATLVTTAPAGSSFSGNGNLASHLKHVMEKRGGVWKIISAQNTFVPAD